MKLYLSGKMSGLVDDGKAAFDYEAARLRSLGFEVWNPAEQEKQPSWEHYMRVDIAALCQCDGVAVLNNWQDSRGARLEVFIATELGIPVYDSPSIERFNRAGCNITDTILPRI